MQKKARKNHSYIFWPFFSLAIILIAIFFIAVTNNFKSTPLNGNAKKLIPDLLIARYSPPGAEPIATRSGFKILGNIIPSSFSIHVPILLYHYIEVNKDPNDTIRHSLTVSPYWFEQQVKYLVQKGYTTITLEDLVDALRGDKDLPPKPIILTFDDGYRDFYTDAFPILKKYNLKATNFVFPNVLDKKNNMDTWMIKELADSGLVTIGSHTLSHIYLPRIPQDLAQREILESKTILERIIGKPVRVFAYPYGAYDQKTIELVRNAGYISAVATIKGSSHSPDSLFHLSRIRIGNYADVLFQKLLDE